MILAPSLIDRSLEAEIPGLCKWVAENEYNVVVLVPSFKAAERWTKAGTTLAQGDEVSKTVERLRTSKGSFVVLANRYDGIDLPDAACRVLVIDGVPTGESYYEQYVSSVRSDSTLVTGRVAQTIEQGLGRGVRSGKDFCVVLLCGSHLVQFVGVKERLNLFSPETKQQFLIGQEIVKQTKEDEGTPRDKLISLMRICLRRDAAWKAYHAKKMVRLAPVVQDPVKLDIAVAERGFAGSSGAAARSRPARPFKGTSTQESSRPIPIRDGSSRWPLTTSTARTPTGRKKCNVRPSSGTVTCSARSPAFVTRR